MIWLEPCLTCHLMSDSKGNTQNSSQSTMKTKIVLPSLGVDKAYLCWRYSKITTCLNQKQLTTCFPALLLIVSIFVFLTSIPNCLLCFGISFIFRLYHCGRVAGKIFCILAVIDLFILWLLEWLFPRKVCLKQFTFYSCLLWKGNA